MLCAIVATLATVGASPASGWFGPARVTLPIQTTGNPYDPAVNDVRVVFRLKDGTREERLAYWNGRSSTWQAVLTARKAGDYEATVTRNGTPIPGVRLTVPLRDRLERGYLRISNRTRFRWDNGQFYTPVGVNVGWSNNEVPDIPAFLRQMGSKGLNWTRIWACHWDGKNPWWPFPDERRSEMAKDGLWEPALEKWDAIAEAADESGVGWQFTLFHHGPWSTRVNSNWGENPWNAKNGGPLKKPGEFFTDPAAKAMVKRYLRYVVARYGHHPDLIAWELWNEVEWVDPRYDGTWSVVTDWHREMASYLRSLDPVKRLVTTSSTLEFPGLYDAMDFTQPHIYAPKVWGGIRAAKLPADKPGFFGEFGPAGEGENNAEVAYEGAMAGLMAAHAGAGQYWYWDALVRENLWPSLTRVVAAANFLDLGRRPNARVVRVAVGTERPGDTSLSFGLGWDDVRSPVVDLNPRRSESVLGGLPSYFQGEAHRDKGTRFTLNLKPTGPVQGRLKVASVSDAGGTLRISVDGQTVAEHAYAKGAPLKTLEFSLAPGARTVVFENLGKDWVQLAGIDLQGFGPSVRVEALRDVNWAAIRMVGKKGDAVSVDDLNLPDGELKGTALDLLSGQRSRVTMKVVKGEIVGFTLPADDVLIVL